MVREQTPKPKTSRWKSFFYILLSLAIIAGVVIGVGVKWTRTQPTSAPATTPTFQPITYTSNKYKPDKYFVTDLPPFSVPIRNWVIDWSYTPIAGGDEFTLWVYPNFGPDTNTEIAKVWYPNTTSGSLTCNSGPGEHQIRVITEYSWSITVRSPN
jgi:hypothetical protein